MKKQSKSQALAQGLTIHAPNSGALALAYGLVDEVSGFHHATVWASGGVVYLRPKNGEGDSLAVCYLTRAGRVAKRSPALRTGVSRQRVARVALALTGLLEFLNGQENEFGLTFLGWVRCRDCGRWLSAGASIVDGRGDRCRNKGKTTKRAQQRIDGLAEMQRRIDAGRA